MARLLLLFLLPFWQAVALAQTPGPLLERAFLTDPQAQMSPEQAAAAHFQPYEGTLRLGFETGAAWIRLTLDKAGEAEDASSRRRVIRIGPNFLERIELYARVDGRWTRQVQGSLIPQAGSVCPDDMHCFVADASPAGASAVYLRVVHRGYMAAQIEVLTPDDLPFAVAERIRGLTVSVVMALGLLALGLALLLVDRSLLLLAYCGFQLTVVLFIASNAGLLAAIFPGAAGERLNLFNSLLYVLRGAMTGFLGWAVLRAHRPTPLYHLGGVLVLVVCAVSSLFVFLGHVRLALQGGLLAIAVIPFWHLYGTLSAKEIPAALRRVLVAGTLFYILMLVLGLWLAFGAEPMTRTGLVRQIADWRLNGFAVGVLFFCVTLMERASIKRARAQELDALRHQALEATARQAELDERSSLIDMLTHELKNPLGTIRFALASLRQSVADASGLKRIQSIDLSARRMDDLIERVANFSKVERAAPSDATSRVDAAVVIQELLPDVARPEQWRVQVQPGATFRCDRQLLWVILENLVSNADKYSMADHTIDIDVATEGGMVRFEISNHVDAACVPDEPRLFDRYYRHPHFQGKAGMGLGLSVVKTAAQKIRGDVAYRHAKGRVFFTLRVPA